MSEIWQLSATELAQRIADRQLSSAEVVNAHLARIEAVNPALNAVVRILADEARAAAALADNRLAAGEKVGPSSGMSPIGLGNDIGGSLRNPANACGIASIRPSAGRVPDAGYVPAEDRLLAVQLMNVQGPMARRVADVRLGLRILMGAHPRDPWSIDAPFDGPPLARPIRVAVVPEPPGGSRATASRGHGRPSWQTGRYCCRRPGHNCRSSTASIPPRRRERRQPGS
jgi:Asp-tRNA(Asn)/Glu-tRNA(Gln) amidotransferase A subunit family amidase